MTDVDHDPVGSIPAGRIGALLRAARSQAGLSSHFAARKLQLSRRQLKAWEQGREPVPDEQLTRMANVYGVGVEALTPARRGVTIDRDSATMRVGHHVEPLPAPEASPEEILAKYLSVLYQLRGAKPTDRIPLRDDDLNALADALGNDPTVIERRLVELMGITRAEAIVLRRIILRRRVFAPAAGLALGAGVLSGFRAFDVGAHHANPQNAPVVSSATLPTNAPPTTAPPTTTPPATVPAPAPTTPHASKPPTPPAPQPVVDGPGSSQASRPPETTLPPLQVAPTTPPTGDPTVVVDGPGDGQVSRPGVPPGG